MHIQRRMLLIASLFLIPVIAAYVQSSIFGLPPIARNSTRSPTTAEPHGVASRTRPRSMRISLRP
jgi:hypothetical protein